MTRKCLKTWRKKHQKPSRGKKNLFFEYKLHITSSTVSCELSLHFSEMKLNVQAAVEVANHSFSRGIHLPRNVSFGHFHLEEQRHPFKLPAAHPNIEGFHRCHQSKSCLRTHVAWPRLGFIPEAVQTNRLSY